MKTDYERRLDDEDEARRLDLFGLTDETIDAVRAGPLYCVIGYHLVPVAEALTSRKGTTVCRGCARTPAGRAELKGRRR